MKLKFDVSTYGAIQPLILSTTVVLTLLSLVFSSILSAEVVTGDIFVDTEWANTTEPYTIPAGGKLQIAGSATLTILPGVRVEFATDEKLAVFGTLKAVGTVDSPITFTPSGTSWGGIEFNDTSTDVIYDGNGDYLSGSLLKHVLISGVSSIAKGAININNSFPGLDFLTVQDNKTTGIYLTASTLTTANQITISNSNINNNETSNKPYSPGITIIGGNQTTIKITSNNFRTNKDTGFTVDSTTSTATADGGGLFITEGAQIEVTGNTFTSNIAENGGAIYIQNETKPVSPNTVIKNNMISGNSANNGGGIFTISSALDITNNQIIGNNANQEGGGIYNSKADLNVFGNIFIKNHATATGGAVHMSNGASNLVFQKNIVYLNSVDDHGGALDFHDGNATISSNTFASNTAARKADVMNANGGTGTFSNNSVQGIGNSKSVILGVPYNFTNNTLAANSNIIDLMQVDVTHDDLMKTKINNNNFFNNELSKNVTGVYIINTEQDKEADPTANPPTLAYFAEDADATMNWWGTTNTDAIINLTRGQFSFGVDTSNFLTDFNTNAPISIPTNVVAAETGTGIRVKWFANKEPDIAGYRVFWSDTPISSNTDLSFIDSVNVDLALEYTIPEDQLIGGFDYYIVVSAYDNIRSISNDLDTTIINENVVAGNESWFSEEASVTWPKPPSPPADSGGSSDYWWLTFMGLIIVLRQFMVNKSDIHLV